MVFLFWTPLFGGVLTPGRQQAARLRRVRASRISRDVGAEWSALARRPRLPQDFFRRRRHAADVHPTACGVDTRNAAGDAGTSLARNTDDGDDREDDERRPHLAWNAPER